MYYWLIGILAAIGLFLRAFSLGSQSLWLDEAYTLNAALSVLKHGIPLLDSGHIYVNNFVSVYLSALMIWLGGLDAFDPWLVRLPAVIFGTGLIILTYILGRKLFDSPRIGIAAAALVAFSYHAIAWSRQVRGYEAAAFLITLAAIFLWLYLTQGRPRRYLWLTWTALGLAALAHWASLSLVPAFLMIPWFFATYGYRMKTHARSVAFLSIMILVAELVIIFTVSLKGLVFRYTFFPFLGFFALILAYIFSRIVDGMFSRRSRVFRSVVFFAGLLIVLSPLLSFAPRALYSLNLRSSLPDYAAAYSVIKREMKSGDIVISANPVFSRLYLGQDGAWFSRQSTPDRVEYYTGLTPIETLDQLISLTTSTHGFVLINGNSFRTPNTNRIRYIVDKFRIYSTFQGLNTSPESPIWLYRY